MHQKCQARSAASDRTKRGCHMPMHIRVTEQGVVPQYTDGETEFSESIVRSEARGTLCSCCLFSVSVRSDGCKKSSRSEARTSDPHSTHSSRELIRNVGIPSRSAHRFCNSFHAGVMEPIASGGGRDTSSFSSGTSAQQGENRERLPSVYRSPNGSDVV